MTKHERIRAAFRREPVDRVPIAFWRHFPVDDQSPAGLAGAVVTFQRKYDFDLVKVTPSSDYMCVDWGLQGEYRGSPGGTREVTASPIERVADWEQLRLLDVSQGSLSRQLEAVRLIAKDLSGDAPILQTIFSPLTALRKMNGERWLNDLRSQPDLMMGVLAVIAETTISFARESLRAGADGVFYAIQEASRKMMSEAEYRRFGEPNDRRILEAVSAAPWNVLHLHGEDILFGLADSFPVAAVNWHDRRTFPSLKAALDITNRGLIGGVNEVSTILRGAPADVRVEVLDALRETDGRGLVVGAGCVIRVDTPEQNIAAAVAAVKDR